MKKILLTLIIGMFLISFISAVPPFAQENVFTEGYEIKYPQDGTLKLNLNHTFSFHIYNISNGVPIDNSSTNCIFHLYESSGKHILEVNAEYDTGSLNNEWEVFVDGGNFSELGEQCYLIQCNSSLLGLGGFASVGFEVTPSGNPSPTSGESILYFVFVTVLFGIFLLTIYFICVLPSGNYNENGVTVGINPLKYLRIFLIAMSYPMLIIILNLLNGLAVNFVSLTIFSGIIGFIFEILLRTAWIFTIVIILWILYLLIKDSNFKKMMKKMGDPLR